MLAAQVLPESAWAQDAAPFRTQAESAPLNPSVYLGIEPDGTVFIVTHRSEMGTGIRTTLPLVAADELDADWSRVRIEQGIGDRALRRSEHRRLAIDSRLLRSVPPRRRLGADDAGERGGGAVERARPASARRRITKWCIDASGRRLGYGALVPAAAEAGRAEGARRCSSSRRPPGGSSARTPPPTTSRTSSPARRSSASTSSATAWCYASIEHPPVLGGTVKSVDDKGALAVKGVQQTVTLDTFKPPHLFQPLGGVAVIADSTWAALQGPAGS